MGQTPGGAYGEAASEEPDRAGVHRVRERRGRGLPHLGDPAAKWRLGVCASATHVKAEVKTEETKVRLGQQKQKKK